MNPGVSGDQRAETVPEEDFGRLHSVATTHYDLDVRVDSNGDMNVSGPEEEVEEYFENEISNSDDYGNNLMGDGGYEKGSMGAVDHTPRYGADTADGVWSRGGELEGELES